jgi:aryl-alcohol dehydrogenase-like predicted oxidoreductase
VTAYGVLSRGLLSGSGLSQGDFRALLPRFAGENGARNRALIEGFTKLARQRGVAPSELAIAWVLAKGSNIVPVIGARKPAQLSESLAALDLRLSADDVQQIEKTLPADAIVGDRYQAAQMQHLDSEK